MEQKLFIPLLLGTVRQGRQSEKAARYLLKRLERHPDIETALIDVREMNLPMDDEGAALGEPNANYRDTILRADGLIIVSPEYNHGYPGSLKRALDILDKEYRGRAVAICGVSSGGLGGARVIEQLAGVVRALGLVITRRDLTISFVQDAFDAEGNPRDSALDKHADTFIAELVWMAKTLRWGREHVPNA